MRRAVFVLWAILLAGAGTCYADAKAYDNILLFKGLDLEDEKVYTSLVDPSTRTPPMGGGPCSGCRPEGVKKGTSGMPEGLHWFSADRKKAELQEGRRSRTEESGKRREAAQAGREVKTAERRAEVKACREAKKKAAVEREGASEGETNQPSS